MARWGPGGRRVLEIFTRTRIFVGFARRRVGTRILHESWVTRVYGRGRALIWSTYLMVHVAAKLLKGLEDPDVLM